MCSTVDPVDDPYRFDSSSSQEERDVQAASARFLKSKYATVVSSVEKTKVEKQETEEKGTKTLRPGGGFLARMETKSNLQLRPISKHGDSSYTKARATSSYSDPISVLPCSPNLKSFIRKEFNLARSLTCKSESQVKLAVITQYKTMIDKSAAKLSGGGNFKKNSRKRNFKLGRRRCKSSSENEVDDDCIEEYNEDDFVEENFPSVDQENTSGSTTESIGGKSVLADRDDIKTEERFGSSCSSSSLVKLDTSEEGKASGCDLDNVSSVVASSDINMDQKTSLTCSFCLCVCSNLQMCSRCQVTAYCGSQCQKEDWYKGHRQQCIISNVVTRSPTRKEKIKSVTINSQPEYESSHRSINNVDEKQLPKSILKRKLPSNECEETSHGAICKNIQLQDNQGSSDHQDLKSDKPGDIYPDPSLDSSGQSCVTPPNSPSILVSIRKNSELRPSVSRLRESRRKDTPYPAIHETKREGLRDYSGERRKDTPYPNMENMMRDIKGADNSPLCSFVSPIQGPKKLSFDDLEESEETHSGSSIVCSSGIKGRKWEELDSSIDGISMKIQPESSVVDGRYTGIESGVMDSGSNNSEDKTGKIIRTLSEPSNEDCTEENNVITEISEISRNNTVFPELELDSYSSCVSSNEGDQGNKSQCSDMFSSEDQVFSDPIETGGSSEDQLTGLFDPGRSSDAVEDEQEPDMLEYL